jgi:hypothetical protein
MRTAIAVSACLSVACGLSPPVVDGGVDAGVETDAGSAVDAGVDCNAGAMEAADVVFTERGPGAAWATTHHVPKLVEVMGDGHIGESFF